jgi:transglutaminase-like putative cysteine protease
MALAVIVLAVGLVIDAIGVTMRRVPVLGLLFLLIYMVPVAHLGGDVSMFSFLPGAIGFVFMLAADESERLTHWGRQAKSASAAWQHGEPQVDDSELLRSRLRIGFGAVAIAAVLPLLLPSIDPRIFFDGGAGARSDNGDGPLIVDDPSLDMRRNLDRSSNDVLLRVSGTEEPAYFRLAALDSFTGDVWEVGERDDEESLTTDVRLPLPLGGSSLNVNRVEYEVEVTEEIDTRWLPTVYAPRQIEVETEWLVDPLNLDVRADSGDDLDGATYTFQASIPTPTLSELRASNEPPPDIAPFLRLPGGMPAIIADTAARAVSGERTPIDQALALQSWFRNGNYTYSLEQVEDDRNRTGLDAVEAFLEDRVGYCEQYASAMALMARQLGIPSRIAVGFLRPELVEERFWEFRGEDMHAWPELFFEGAGWIRFEPTPQSVSQEAPVYRDADPTTGGPTSAPTESEEPLTDRTPEPSDGANAAGDSAGDGGGVARTALLVVVGLAGLALVLSTPRLLRAAKSRRRWQRARQPQQLAEAAWADLRDHAVDLRVGWDDGATPRHAGRTLREHLRGGAKAEVVAALNQLVLAVERSRYARGVDDDRDLRASVERVRAALALRRTAGQQRLAAWLPASLWHPAPGDRRARGRTAAPHRDSVLTLGGG